MALTSVSTAAEIEAAYVDNSMYDINRSVAQCRLFIQAARILLAKRPTTINTDGVSRTLDPKDVRDSLRRAEAWLSANDTTRRNTSARYWDMGDLRA